MTEARTSWVGIAWWSMPAAYLAGIDRRSYTLPFLVRHTVGRTPRAAGNCQAVPTGVNLTARIWDYRVTCREKNSHPAGHRCQIHVPVTVVEGGRRFQQPVDGVDRRDLHVQVRCSCPAFVYWVSQWHGAQQGYLFGSPRGLLLPPEVRFRFKDGASTVRSLICKHLVLAAADFLAGPPL